MSNLRASLFEMAIKDGIDKTLIVAQRWHDALSEVSDAIGTDVSSGSHALKERAKEIQAAMDRLRELKADAADGPSVEPFEERVDPETGLVTHHPRGTDSAGL